jgi:hypothetical protein
MAHSKEAHGKHAAMEQFKRDHWQKNEGDLNTSDLKYCEGEMRNPEHLMKSNQMLSSYVKKERMSYP